MFSLVYQKGRGGSIKPAQAHSILLFPLCEIGIKLAHIKEDVRRVYSFLTLITYYASIKSTLIDLKSRSDDQTKRG